MSFLENCFTNTQQGRLPLFILAAHGQAVLRPTSQALRASSPSRGASGEEAKLYGMPKPPLGRGGGTP